MNIYRGVASSFVTHSHLCSALVKKRRVAGEGGGSGFDFLIGFIFYPFGASILRKLLLGFSQDKSVFFLWYCFFQWSSLYAFVMKMKWNTDVLAKHMKI